MDEKPDTTGGTSSGPIALPTATVSWDESRESGPSSLPLRGENLFQPGSIASEAMAVPVQPVVIAEGLSLGLTAASPDAAGDDEKIARALAFAETSTPTTAVTQAVSEGRNGVIHSNVHDPTGTIVSDDRGHEAGNSRAEYGETVSGQVDPGLTVPTAEGSCSAPTALENAVHNSSNRFVGLQSSGHGQFIVGDTRSRANSVGIAMAESSTSADDGIDQDARGEDEQQRGRAADEALGDESDTGSVDEDNVFFTWFSTRRRASGGQRRHGRGTVRGEKVYDSVRINDNAEEMNTLRQQLAEGTVDEREGREKLRALGDKIYTIKIGDAIEINSGNDSHPYVGTLLQLDRDNKRIRVRWFYLGHEVEEHLQQEMGPKEILMCDNAKSIQNLDTVIRKVSTVRAMPPNGEDLPPNTYLCYRGYDRRRKDFAPLLEDGSLSRRQRGRRLRSRRDRARARAAMSSRASSPTEGVSTPRRRASSSSSIMSPSQEDSDGPDLVLMQRWNRVGPDFDVDVPAWTGPLSGPLTPPLEDRHTAQEQFDSQQVWSCDHAATPFHPDALTEYLETAKSHAPIFPGTIVFIRPRADGQWGDGSDRKHPRSHGIIGASAEIPDSVDRLGEVPRLRKEGRSAFRWGLVSEAPSGEEQMNVKQEHANTIAEAAGGSSYVGMTERVAAGAARVEMPPAPRPQWFAQQQQHQKPERGMQQQPPMTMQQPERHSLLDVNRQGWSLEGAGSQDITYPRVVGAPSESMSTQDGYVCGAQSWVAGLSRGRGIESMGQESIVWITNPREGELPLPVERSRVMVREFKDEAMSVLRGFQGNFRAALEVVLSKNYQDELKKRMTAAGEIWTFEQVKAAVKVCNEASSACEKLKGLRGQLGDELRDEEGFGVPSKAFRTVVDFGRRFNNLSRFGDDVKPFQPAASTAAGATSATTVTSRKRQRPKQGTYDAKLRRQSLVGGGGIHRGAGRNRGRAVRSYQYEDEEEEEEDEEQEEDNSTDDWNDATYTPDDSDESSLDVVTSTKRRRTRHSRGGDAEEAADSASGDSIGEDDERDTEVLAEGKSGARPTFPVSPPPSHEILNLCSSEDENDEDRDVETAGSSGADIAPETLLCGETGGGSDRDRYQMLTPATAAEAAAAAAARETQGIAAEAAARAGSNEAQAENGGPAATAGGGGGAGMPHVRDDSPLPGVESGNTGGEAMAPRSTDDTDYVLKAFLMRVKTTLKEEPFGRFLAALAQYREQHSAVDQLVDMVRECFNHREEPEMRLFDEFNTFLPPGYSVQSTRP